MTRWKSEFKRWCEAEKLRGYAMPKKPEHWAVAKHLSRLIDYEMRNANILERAVMDGLLYGRSPLVPRV